MKQSLIKQNILPSHINNGRLRLSPSKLIVWAECKMRFKALLSTEIRDEGTIYTAIGRAAHSVIEDINKGADLTTAQRADLFKIKLIEECSVEDIPLNFTLGFKEVRNCLADYHIPDGWKMLMAENKKTLEFGRFDFSYIIDGLWHNTNDDSIHIVDYKTSAKAPSSNLQLMLYAWATSILYPDIKDHPIHSSYHMLRTNTIVSHSVSLEDIESMQTWVDEQVSLIEESFALDFFKLSPGPYCRYCTKLDCPQKTKDDDTY